MKFINGYSEKIHKLKQAIDDAEKIVIGAGSGLSTSGGIAYSGERFQKNFADFITKYHFKDMFSATFYPYNSPQEYWAYMSRHIVLNRYAAPVGAVYYDLFNLIKDKDYFVITTNVDHQFQKAGFDKERLFYTQGDYGLFQCSVPCHNQTYDNEETVMKMAREQTALSVPKALIPYCPKCGKPISMNLRCDNSFVENDGWRLAQRRYNKFIGERADSKVLYLELGVGNNTPVIIKFPFWLMTAQNPKAVYACVNLGETFAPNEIKNQSICIDNDISEIIHSIRQKLNTEITL
ncbi:MAG: hypothetical protein LBU73_04440 [Helicobacteraceae bacterium]|jgi:NAD-dependent SIR2 family protein deacetylase|nr:hypothetical protein [Helicobacteraceae bacterium]